HFSERLLEIAEGIVKLEDFRRAKKYFHLVEEISAHKLGDERRSSRQKCSWQILVGGGQDQTVAVGDGNFIDQRVFLGGSQLCSQAFADFECMPNVVMDFLGSV